MTDEPANGNLVKYTVKELLTEIHNDIRAMDLKLDTKADTTQLEDLRVRVGVLETQVTREDAEKQYRRWLTFGGPLIGALALGSLVLTAINIF